MRSTRNRRCRKGEEERVDGNARSLCQLPSSMALNQNKTYYFLWNIKEKRKKR